MTSTMDDLQAEIRYLFGERLGILCGDRMPTRNEVQLALADCVAWLRTTGSDADALALLVGRPGTEGFLFCPDFPVFGLS